MKPTPQGTNPRKGRPYCREEDGHIRVYTDQHRLVGFVDRQDFTSIDKDGKRTEKSLFIAKARGVGWKVDTKRTFQTQESAVTFVLGKLKDPYNKQRRAMEKS